MDIFHSHWVCCLGAQLNVDRNKNMLYVSSAYIIYFFSLLLTVVQPSPLVFSLWEKAAVSPSSCPGAAVVVGAGPAGAGQLRFDPCRTCCRLLPSAGASAQEGSAWSRRGVRSPCLSPNQAFQRLQLCHFCNY